VSALVKLRGVPALSRGFLAKARAILPSIARRKGEFQFGGKKWCLHEFATRPQRALLPKEYRWAVFRRTAEGVVTGEIVVIAATRLRALAAFVEYVQTRRAAGAEL
jgi:hypothetical protein